MPPDHREHPAAYACRLYNDRLARSGSPLRWVTLAAGGMGLRRLDEGRGPSVSNNYNRKEEQ